MSLFAEDRVHKSTILKCRVGPQAYGLSTEASDEDHKGVCIEPLEVFVGFPEFEQLERRTATERTGDKKAKSQEGDLDLTIYGLRKFLRLALAGNPTIVELLFIKDQNRLIADANGLALQELAPHIVSKQAGRRFLGYMQAQKQRLLGEIGQKKINRVELEEKFGYDTKYAMHIVRLAAMGVELLETGFITLPMVGPELEFCKAIRAGQVDLTEVLNHGGILERKLKDLLGTSFLPEHPNQDAVEAWMIDVYWRWWRAQRVMYDTLRLEGDRLVPVSGKP